MVNVLRILWLVGDDVMVKYFSSGLDNQRQQTKSGVQYIGEV